MAEITRMLAPGRESEGHDERRVHDVENPNIFSGSQPGIQRIAPGITLFVHLHTQTHRISTFTELPCSACVAELIIVLDLTPHLHSQKRGSGCMYSKLQLKAKTVI